MRKWFLKRRVCRKLQAGLCSLVVVSLSLAPASVEATQSGTQTSNGNTNKMASMLSAGVGLLSVASGALTMAKGIKQMACCMKGCTGAGTEGVAKEQANKEVSRGVASELGKKSAADLSGDGKIGVSGISVPGSGGEPKPANRTAPEFNLRFPDSASLAPDFLPLAAGARLNLLVRLFRAPTVVASGCLDAGLAITTGGIMLLQGMMALNTAKQASALADSSYANAGNLGVLDGTGGLGANGTVAPGESRMTGSSVGGAGEGKSQIKIDPALLRNGKADGVMSRFEKEFGIDRDKFADDILGGKDPREVLATAPKNPISVSDMNKATSGARGMSDAEKSDALASSDLAELQKEIAANAGFGLEDSSYQSAGKSGGSGYRKLASASESLDDLSLDGELSAAAGGDPNVSPEIKAALARRDEVLARKSHVDTSLFEVVHRKYVEKAKMISGAGIKAVGVVHATE